MASSYELKFDPDNFLAGPREKFGDLINGIKQKGSQAINNTFGKLLTKKVTMDFRQPQDIQAAVPQQPSASMMPQPSMQPSMSPMPFATPRATPNPVLTNSAYPQGSTSPYVYGQNISKQEIERKIRAGYRDYSGGKEVPMEQYIGQMMGAVDRFPAFAKNPFLIPAISNVETSAGQNWKLNKNPISWAAREQMAGNYSPSSPEMAIEDMITAVGGDPNRGAGYDPVTAQARMRTSGYYQPFRDTNNLWDLSETYENSSGNPKYWGALIQELQRFERQ